MTDAPMESKPAVLDEVQYAGPAAPPLPAITEQPELVAQGICQFADTVGRERVIAGTDCGFGTFAGYGKIRRFTILASKMATASTRGQPGRQGRPELQMPTLVSDLTAS
jgi:hypothetical protein